MLKSAKILNCKSSNWIMMMFVNLINQNVARHDNIASNYPSPSLPIITIPWSQLRSLLPWSRTPPTLHCLILLLDSLLISCPASETPQPFHHGKYYCQIFPSKYYCPGLIQLWSHSRRSIAIYIQGVSSLNLCLIFLKVFLPRASLISCRIIVVGQTRVY